MTLGLDIDGTITNNPRLYSVLSKAIRAEGGRVVIISARIRKPDVIKTTEKELAALGIHYDHIQLLPLHDEEKISYPFEEREDDIWVRMAYQKALVCMSENVDVMIDDDPTVIRTIRKYASHVYALQPVNA